MTMDSSGVLFRPAGFRQVVVVSGHMTDGRTRSEPRFPEHAVSTVRAQLERTLRAWDLDDDCLLITGGARGADLLAATAARRLGATVWVLLAEPPDLFEEHSVAGGDGEWVDEFRWLIARAPTWVLNRPGAPDDGDAIYAATNRWMLAVAAAQADGRPIRLIAVWDGVEAPSPGGTGDMVAAARSLGAEIAIIDPGT